MTAVTPRKVFAVLRFLSLRDVSEYTGVNINTLKSLDRSGRFPQPDAQVGLGEHKQIARGWTRDTIDAWTASRSLP